MLKVTSYEAWKYHVDRSRRNASWQIDTIHNKPGDAIIFRPAGDPFDSSGFYVQLIESRLSGGTYEGAHEHIGDALFTQEWSLETKDLGDGWHTFVTLWNKLVSESRRG